MDTAVRTKYLIIFIFCFLLLYPYNEKGRTLLRGRLLSRLLRHGKGKDMVIDET